MGVETADWWQDLLAKKDTHSLKALAAEFDTTPGAISLALRRTNTSRTPQGDVLPPEAGESRPGSKDDLIVPFREMLGQIPDGDIAKRAGVSVRTVASYRARNQIPGFKGRGPSDPNRPRKRRRSRIDPFADIVGKVPDKIVASKAGVTLNAVRNYRASRNIPSSRDWRRQQREAQAVKAATDALRAQGMVAAGPEPATLEAPKPVVIQPKGSGFVWKIRFDSGVEGYVTGGNLMDAAAAATTTGHGHVLNVERIGVLL